MLKLTVVSTPKKVQDQELWGKTAIAVDVLRATSTIVAAFEAGCSECYPANTLEEARAMRRTLGEGTLLGGERHGLPPDDFDLGNSPREYTKARLNGRLLVFVTTNGTLAIRRTGRSRHGLVASLANARAVALEAMRLRRDIVVICAGTQDRFSLEDTIGAGAIVDSLLKQGQKLALTDLATAASDLFTQHANKLPELLRRSVHGQTLIRLGFEADLARCAQLNVSEVVPVYYGTSIRPQLP